VSPFLRALVLLSCLLSSATPAFAAALAPDVVPLAAAGPAGGRPTALAAADLDADGVPDLIVAYASGDATTLVAYPGDVEAIYPSPARAAGAAPATIGGGAAAVSDPPFRAPRVLAAVDGRVDELIALDADADGIEDVVASSRALGGAALLAAIGDGTVVESDVLDAETVAALRVRAAALAPRQLAVSAPAAFDVVPDAFFMQAPDGTRLGYRPSEDAKRALRQPAKPIVLAAPSDATAVVRMRLNADAVADLVVLRPGLPAPEALISRASATFTVTTTKDETGSCDDSCSLREAIVAANATPDLDTIAFAIPTSDPGFQPGTGTWLIAPTSDEMPVITGPVTIDGRTQPGFVDRPVIELSGENLSEDRVGLIVVGSNSVVRGLIVSAWPAFREGGESFCGCGIDVESNNSIIEGNYVGTDATGTQSKPNGQNGIAVISGGSNLIGGTTAQARNLVSGNREGFFFNVAMGTFISSSATNNTFSGNWVGLDATGFNALPNSIGVLLNSANNTIGGTLPGSGNVIAGNASDMISIFESGFVSADGNDVLRNFIGTNVAGTGSFNEGFGYGVAVTDADNTVIGSPGNGNLISGNDYGILIKIESHRSTSGHLIQGNTIGLDALGRPNGNGAPGVKLDNVFNATIGGTGTGEPNTIASNSSAGVVVNFLPTCGGCTTGTLRSNQNRISANRIHANTGRGIDLGTAAFGDGVTANDGNDADTGANDLLNWPVLTSATSTMSTSTVNGQALTQGPQSGSPYRLQFFASPSCDTVGGNGEGQVFLGEADRNADGNPFSVNLNAPIPSGFVVTATATDALGNTSEFSNCVTASGGPAPVASATATPVPTTTVPKTPAPGATPTVAPTNVPGVEICDNCRDDDGDTIVDRADPDCGRPYADGGGARVATTARAKALVKCQTATVKQGASLVDKEQKLLRGCLQKTLACVQAKNADPACLAKTKCAGLDDVFEALEDKFEAKIEKACGPPVLETDLVNQAGLGYGREAATCQASPIFVFGADDPNGVARCLEGRHRCQAAQIVSQEFPRARALLTLGGANPSLVSGCLPNPGVTGSDAVDPTQSKAFLKCAGGIQKAASKYLKSRLGGFRKCLASVTKCVQLKPGDAACLGGARAKCLAGAAKLGDDPKGAGGKFRAAVAKACVGVDAALLATNGLGHSSLAAYCAAVGVPALATASDVADCLARHHSCRAGQLLDAEAPRARELLELGGIAP
jgi:CSLREA domain-containing protein